MCSTFFKAATIGSVATAILFFITFCPYVLILIFDTKLNGVKGFLAHLSFTTAFSHSWSYIMRMELQEVGLQFTTVWHDGLNTDFGFAVFMILFDTGLYILVAVLYRHWTHGLYLFQLSLIVDCTKLLQLNISKNILLFSR